MWKKLICILLHSSRHEVLLIWPFSLTLIFIILVILPLPAFTSISTFWFFIVISLIRFTSFILISFVFLLILIPLNIFSAITHFSLVLWLILGSTTPSFATYFGLLALRITRFLLILVILICLICFISSLASPRISCTFSSWHVKISMCLILESPI